MQWKRSDSMITITMCDRKDHKLRYTQHYKKIDSKIENDFLSITCSQEECSGYYKNGTWLSWESEDSIIYKFEKYIKKEIKC